MDAVGRVGSHWHCLTLVVISGLAQQRHAGEECLQNLSAVLPTGYCIWRLGPFVKSLAVVLQAAQLRVQAFKFQLLPWFQ